MAGAILKLFHAFPERGCRIALQSLCHIFLDFLYRGIAIHLHLQFELGEQEIVKGGGTHIQQV